MNDNIELSRGVCGDVGDAGRRGEVEEGAVDNRVVTVAYLATQGRGAQTVYVRVT